MDQNPNGNEQARQGDLQREGRRDGQQPIVPSDTEQEKEEEEKQEPESGREPLKLVYTNAHSILSKLDHLNVLIKDENPHFICITETWLNDSIPNA